MQAMPGAVGFKVLYYQTVEGRRPVEEWLDELRADHRARAAIQVRIDRLELGLMADWKGVGDGVGEVRVDFGPGYRLYFGRDGQKVVVLLCGGSKGTQRRDIRLAKHYWRDYGARKKPAGSAA
jgi:putative addiction module killer protein